MGIAILLKDADFSTNNIGKVTPIYNYNVLDFIATKSTNYLDSGIYFSEIASFETVFWLDNASQESFVLGSHDNDTVNYWSNQLNASGGKMYCFTLYESVTYPNHGELYEHSSSILQSKTYYTVEYKKQEYAKLNGTAIPVSMYLRPIMAGTVNRTVYIFNANNGSTADLEDKPGLIGIKSVIFRDSANLIIFNIIPVLFNNIPYYYNTINAELLPIHGNNEIWYKPLNSETLIQYQ